MLQSKYQLLPTVTATNFFLPLIRVSCQLSACMLKTNEKLGFAGEERQIDRSETLRLKKKEKVGIGRHKIFIETNCIRLKLTEHYYVWYTS